MIKVARKKIVVFFGGPRPETLSPGGEEKYVAQSFVKSEHFILGGGEGTNRFEGKKHFFWKQFPTFPDTFLHCLSFFFLFFLQSEQCFHVVSSGIQVRSEQSIHGFFIPILYTTQKQSKELSHIHDPMTPLGHGGTCHDYYKYFFETSRPRARFFGEIVPSGVMWGKGSKKASVERGGFLDQ